MIYYLNKKNNNLYFIEIRNKIIDNGIKYLSLELSKLMKLKSFNLCIL